MSVCLLRIFLKPKNLKPCNSAVMLEANAVFLKKGVRFFLVTTAAGKCRNCGCNCRCLAWREFLSLQRRQQVDSPATFNQHRTSDCAISFRLAYLVIEPATEMKGDCVPSTREEAFHCLVPNSLAVFTLGSRFSCNCYLMSHVGRGGHHVYLVYCERFAPCPFWGSWSAYWFTWF